MYYLTYGQVLILSMYSAVDLIEVFTKNGSQNGSSMFKLLLIVLKITTQFNNDIKIEMQLPHIYVYKM